MGIRVPAIIQKPLLKRDLFEAVCGELAAAAFCQPRLIMGDNPLLVNRD